MATAVVASSAGRATAATSLTVSHTVPAGTNRYLVVLVDCSADVVLTGTYGGVPLSVLSELPGALHLVVLGLVNPTVGTANVVLTGSPAGTLAASVVTLTDCVYVSTLTAATGTSTAPSVTVASVAGALVLDIVAAAVAGVTFTVGPGQTSILEQDGLSGSAGRIATSSEAGAPSVTLSWTLSASTNWVIGALTAAATVLPQQGHVSQTVVELLSQPVLPAARVSQQLTELLSLPVLPPARVTQDAVELLTSVSVATAPVPNVVGLTLAAATTTITAAGFTVGTVTEA